jgi:hypothetical protein
MPPAARTTRNGKADQVDGDDEARKADKAERRSVGRGGDALDSEPQDEEAGVGDAAVQKCDTCALFRTCAQG